MRNRERVTLFSKYDLRAVLDAQLSRVDDRVIAVPKERFVTETDEMLAASIASELVVSPIDLHEDDISVSSEDAKVDVSQDFNRAISDRSRPFYLDGLRVTYHVPYSGDKSLLECHPSRSTFHYPRAVIGDGELRFPFDVPGRDVAATKGAFEADLRHVKQWLPWVNEQVEQYNSSVESAVRGRVIQRRTELDRTEQDISSLGYKVRSKSPPGPKPPTPHEAKEQRGRTRAQARRPYDVALSFAGEDREYVEAVAEALRTAGVEVFYDGFEQVELWGKDLAEHLGNVYGSDARFVVLFVSKAYAAKAWPKHEKQFALARQIQSGEERVLPVRFVDTEIPGLPPTVAYLDLRVLTPTKLAELIRQKVDRSEP